MGRPFTSRYPFLSALLLLWGALFVGACSWFAPKRPSRIDRHQFAFHVRNTIEEAGGSQVWVKIPAGTPFPPGRADAVTEVLALPATFDAVITAIRQAAGKDGAALTTREIRFPARGRGVEIRLLEQNQLLGRWRLHEVKRLYRAAIVIDDLGEDLEAARRLLHLPYPLTFSVLPYLRHSVETAEEAHQAGREVMLHLPMQPEPGTPVSPGQGEIKRGMRSEEVGRTLRADLAAVPYATGVNNHMGSRATADAALMTTVMEALEERRLYFVDSRTTAASVALEAARRARLPAFYRSVFLDDRESVAYSLGQLREFRRVVEEQGVAIAIGHPHATTLAALAQFLPELERDNIQLVPASELVHLPEVAHLSPPRRPEP